MRAEAKPRQHCPGLLRPVSHICLHCHLQQYGWYILFAVILYLSFQEQIESSFYRWRRKIEYRAASSAERVAEMEAERRRIREEQQRNVIAAAEEAAKLRAASVKPMTTPEAKKPSSAGSGAGSSSSGSSDYNPLTGKGGSVRTSRIVSTMRSQRKGG